MYKAYRRILNTHGQTRVSYYYEYTLMVYFCGEFVFKVLGGEDFVVNTFYKYWKFNFFL